LNTGIDEKTKNKIIGVVKAVFPKAKIYLYGSRATGDFHDRSDIDIAVDMGKQVSRFETGEVRDMLEASNVPYHFDVVDLHSVNEQMQKDILQEGIIWSD